MIISASIAASSLRPAEAARLAADAGADRIHFDIVDSGFVQGVGLTIDDLRSVTEIGLPVDVHLMVRRPCEYISEVVRLGGASALVHPNAETALRALREAHEAGIEKGLAVSPDDSIVAATSLAIQLDYLLVLGVQPGGSGRMMEPETRGRLRIATEILRTNGASTSVIADGGINENTIGQMCDAGLHQIVVGSALFRPEANAGAVLSSLRLAFSG